MLIPGAESWACTLACPPFSHPPCWFLCPQRPLPLLAWPMQGPRSALPTRLGVTSTLRHSHARELEHTATFATSGTPLNVPQGALWQLYELATILLEDSTKICYPYILLMTCKWTSIFITCIQHTSIPNACSEGTGQPRQALHPLLLHDLLLTGHGRRFCHNPCCLCPGLSAPTPALPTSSLPARSRDHLCNSSAVTGPCACSRPRHPLPGRPARREVGNPTRKGLRLKMPLPDSSSSLGEKKSPWFPFSFLQQKSRSCGCSGDAVGRSPLLALRSQPGSSQGAGTLQLHGMQGCPCRSPGRHQGALQARASPAAGTKSNLAPLPRPSLGWPFEGLCWLSRASTGLSPRLGMQRGMQGRNIKDEGGR